MDFLLVLTETFTSFELALVAYIIVISFTGLILMGMDKKKARKGEWRVRETTIIVIAFMGGAIGVLIGMIMFKHKFNKKKFRIGVPVLYVLNKLSQTLILYYLG